MQTKTIVLVLCSLMAVGALVPAVQAAHMTFYVQGFHEQMSSFEPVADDNNNKNGPADNDARAIPAESDIPSRFHGLSDILGSVGSSVYDHQMYSSVVEGSGLMIPANYYVGNVAQPRTTPTSMHLTWFGNFNDLNGNGIIDDKWCATDGTTGCGGTDEFQWRGANTGESFSNQAWFFPGDYDGSTGAAAHAEPAGLAGSCTQFPGADCITPSPDMPYADSTAAAGNPDNQRWAGNNGGGAFTFEEFLVVNQHVVSIVGSASLAEGSGEQFKVDCTTLDGCFRDYDWYQALAGDDVDTLYTSLLRSTARDLVWVPYAEDFELPLPGGDILEVEPCPQVVPSEFYGCVKDTRQTDAVGTSGTTTKAYARQTWDTVVPAYTNTPRVCAPTGNCAPPQGLYGDLDVERNTFAPYSSYAPGAFLRVNAEAFIWQDANGDGYIGAPPQAEIDAYNLGLDNSANNGACDQGAGGDCELILKAGTYDGKTVDASPGAGGWPPGSLVFRNYDTEHWSAAGFSAGPWLEGPAVGTVSLRMDGERCKDGYYSCRSIDALFIPQGSLGGVNGAVAGGVSVSWTEGTTTFSVPFPGTFSASL